VRLLVAASDVCVKICRRRVAMQMQTQTSSGLLCTYSTSAAAASTWRCWLANCRCCSRIASMRSKISSDSGPAGVGIHGRRD
jgi:hypothetical protein